MLSKNKPSKMTRPKHSRQYFIDRIKKEGGFDFVGIDTVVYPDNKNIYSTINVITKNHKQNLRFVSADKVEKPVTPSVNKPDVIDQRIMFDQLEFKLIQANEIDLKDTNCPVFHCVSNFSHPKMKPWLQRFNMAVIRQRSFIVHTLRNDPNPERRAAAAFLLGHLRDPQDLVSLLSPQVTDPDEGVRNNVMRVIVTTLMKTKTTGVNVEPFLDLLNSPYVTDRNKSLCIILLLAGSPGVNQMIVDKGKDNLIALLRLQQPNNHEVAYQILKKISGKQYGEFDIAAWQAWFDRPS